MMATCAICKELITGRPVLEVVPDRPKLEMEALADSACNHLRRYHPEQIGGFVSLTTLIIQYLSVLALESDAPEFPEEREKLKKTVLDAVSSCELVRRVDKDFAAPVGGVGVVEPSK